MDLKDTIKNHPITKRYLPLLPFAYGTGIAIANLYNYKLSPCYGKKGEGMHSGKAIQILTISSIKGYIYSVFWPISLLGMFIDKFDDCHFIPCSKYFNCEDK